MLILTGEQQRKVEEKAVAQGISDEQMMENAGAAAASFLDSRYDIHGKTVAILCGRGGNGGDGFAAARLLNAAGARAVIILCDKTPTRSAAARMYKRALSAAIPVVDFMLESEAAARALRDSTVIVDAVFGIGFHGNLPEDIKKLFIFAMSLKKPLVSLDIPSGVAADSGLADDGAITADQTICFIAKKPAHIMKVSAEYCGECFVADLRVPASLFTTTGNVMYQIVPGEVAAFLKKRDPVSHKGTFGKLVITAGSDEYRGAAALCALGALRSGAGLVKVCSPSEKALAAVAAHAPEATLFDIGQGSVDVYEQHIAAASAVVVGCGLGEADYAQKLAELTMMRAAAPVVVDADGIKALKKNIHIIKQSGVPFIITPHIGEFSMFADIDVAEVFTDRYECARSVAAQCGCIVVLKSENTVVAAPSGEMYVNTAGNPGMAKGGSGDLLSGIIGSLCAMGVPPLSAAILGVWLHSAAADIAVRTTNENSLCAGDIAAHISDAMNELQKQRD